MARANAVGQILIELDMSQCLARFSQQPLGLREQQRVRI
ncbi:hypothetical protein ISE1_2694 [plant metagenome]|uniref:Uncharacterized protein n=1 Tax=plant metagenome TaxID=1297885 RepID=A0A484U1T6_9ZZZZ